MASLRITVTPAGDDAEALADLATQLRGAMDDRQRLVRMAGLSLPGAAPPQTAAGAADRVFRLDLPDGDLASGVLRALGGWLMRHPRATVAVKADGPSGGVSLRLEGWSAVAFAAAVSRVQQQLGTGPHG